MVDILKINDLEQLKPFLNNDNIIEIAIRSKNKKFKAFQKISLDTIGQQSHEQQKVLQNIINNMNKNNNVNIKNMELLNNVAKLDQLNLLMNGLNLCATCVGFAIVCKKINEMSKEINEVLSVIKTTNDLYLNSVFSKCVSEHENMLDHRKRQDYFSLNRMEKMLVSEYETLRLLVEHFIKNTVNDKNILLYSILTMSSMLSVSLRYYDEMYYLEYKDKINNGEIWHTSHYKWTSIFDKIASADFLKRVQDYGYLELRLTTSGCDAFYINVKDSVMIYKQEVVDNQKLLVLFENKELLDTFNEHINAEIRTSINDAINQSNEIKKFKDMEDTLYQCMQQVGIIK